MLTENICCNCHWYEGVKAVAGTAPCSKHNKQVLWNEDCDEIWLIPERLKIEKENHPQDPDIWNLLQNEVVAMRQDLEKCKKDIETIGKAISPMLMAEAICRMRKEE